MTQDMKKVIEISKEVSEDNEPDKTSKLMATMLGSIVMVIILFVILTMYPFQKSIPISFKASSSPDIKGYKVFIDKDKSKLSLSSLSHDIGNNSKFDLRDFDLSDDTYYIGIVSYDTGGIYSKMIIFEKSLEVVGKPIFDIGLID